MGDDLRRFGDRTSEARVVAVSAFYTVIYKVLHHARTRRLDA